MLVFSSFGRADLHHLRAPMATYYEVLPHLLVGQQAGWLGSGLLPPASDDSISIVRAPPPPLPLLIEVQRLPLSFPSFSGGGGSPQPFGIIKDD